jgi:hypothetical protein
MSETKDIVGPILDAFRQCGIFALRMNAGKISKGKRWITLAPAGTPDIVVYPRGQMPLWIECKLPTGKYASDQVDMAIKLTGLGHKVMRITSPDQITSKLLNELR